MKKLVLLAAVLLSSVGVFAQHEVGSINIQPKVGINIANLTDAHGADARVGFVIGAESEYQLADIFSLTAGLLYSQQGAKDSEDGVDATVKLDYINIPILANVYVTKGLAVKLGIQPGFNVNGKAKVEVIGVEVETDYPGTRSFEFSIPVGVSYEYANFQLDARYNWGITKVIDNLDFKNSVFQITLGYKFDL